jgi:host factor-I protein
LRQIVAFGKRAEGGFMKDAVDSLPASETEGFANRKLIRPAMNRTEHSHSPHNGAPQSAGERRERPERGHDRSNGGGGKKTAPPEQTNAENFYYQKQMQSKTPMVIVLRDGEQIHGVIEWYDKSCIKVVRNGGANLLIYKPAIKYLFKEGENSGK